MSPARTNTLILLLCAFALASIVEPVPGRHVPLFWLARAIGVTAAIAALVWPRLQRTALAAVVLFLVVVPCAQQMLMRRSMGPETWCHDSVVQFEEAIRIVRAGGNPYVADYKGTPLERWRGWSDNPALHHFVYPPFLLYLSVPFEAAGRALGFYDQRIVLLLFFAALLALLHRPFRDHPHGVAAAALIALNPWFGPFVVEGRTDVVMIFWVVAAWLAHASGRSRWGYLFIGLALATKTLLLPIVPFFVVAYRKDAVACALLILAPLLLSLVPFLAMDAPALLEDLFGSSSGWGDRPFEMRGWGGFGFANVVLALGLVKSPSASFPFILFQLAAVLPCLYFGLRSVYREPGFANALAWGVAAIFLVLFFGRFIHDNYIGALLSLAVISQAAREIGSMPRGVPVPT